MIAYRQGQGRPRSMQEEGREQECVSNSMFENKQLFSPKPSVRVLTCAWGVRGGGGGKGQGRGREKGITGKSRYLFGSCKDSKKTVYQSVSLGSCESGHRQGF